MLATIRTILILVVLVLGFNTKLGATHIVGGEIIYKHLGGDNYKVILIVYRDCFLGQAQFDRPAFVSIYGDNKVLFKKLEIMPSSITKLPSDISDSCFFVPSGVCVERGYYEQNVSLPQNDSGYVLTWQRCCRNGSIKNLNNPGDWGSTITTHVTPRKTANTNSSPEFKNLPPLAICLGSDFQFDYSATDDDGDSLVYELCEVLHGGGKDASSTGPNGPKPLVPTAPPYQGVGWATGFSPTNPIDANPSFKIDPNTGLFTGTPLFLGQYVFGICVNEYRGSVLIGTTRREYQVNVKACVSATEAKTVAPAECNGLSVSFENLSKRSTSYSWDFGVSGINSDTSTKELPTYTFPDSGTYTIRLIANPGWKCADTFYQKISIYHNVIAGLKDYGDRCISNPVFDFEADGDYQPYTNITWNFGSNAKPQLDTGAQIKGVSFDTVGIFKGTLTFQHKTCRSVKEFDIKVLPNLKPEFLIRGAKGCTPLQVQLVEKSKAWTDIHTIWTVDNKTYRDSLQRISITEPGEYVVSHQAYTSTGCTDTSDKIYSVLKVLEGPTAKFSISDQKVSIFDPYIEVKDFSINANTCQLFFGDEKTVYDCNTNHSFTKPGRFKVSQIVTNTNGCIDTSSVYVDVDNEFAFFIPSAFSPNNDGNNEIFKPVIVGAKEIEFTIYDRWGHVVFYTEDLREGWNGMRKNEDGEAAIGTYVYKIKVKDFLDQFHFYSNNVYLIR